MVWEPRVCVTWEQVSCGHLFAGQGWCPDGVKDPWRSNGYYNKWGAPRPLTAGHIVPRVVEIIPRFIV